MSQQDAPSGNKVLHIAFIVIALLMILYFTASVHYAFLPPYQNINLHLAFAFVVLFLGKARQGGKWLPIGLGLVILSLAATGWVHYFNEELIDRAMVSLTTGDIIVGILLILLVLEGTRQFFGWPLVIIAIICLTYTFTAVYIPGRWGIPFASLTSILSLLDMNMSSGIYGRLLGVSQAYVFLFIVFGGLLGAVGGTDFFIEVGKIVGRQLKGGSALVAAISSALVGMISGSSSANIIITGSFTIPAMKEAGYKPAEAGAIEAAASTGGMLMPPVMSATGFVMAAIMGVPYKVVMIAAAIPAILYYLGIATIVQRIGEKRNIAPIESEVDIRKLLLSAPLFFIPLGIIAGLLLMDFSPGYSVFWGILSIFVLPMLRAETRKPKRIFEGLIKGAATGASVAVSLGCLGLVVISFEITGLSIQLGRFLAPLAAGSVFLAAGVTMVMALVLGCGAHVMGSYLVVILITGPLLMSLGLSSLQTHMLCGYFAFYGMLSPPVGFASMLASRLAGSKYMITGLNAMKVAAAGIMVPLMFIYSEALLLRFSGPPLVICTQIVGAVVIVVFLGCFLTGYFLHKLNFLQMVMMAMGLASAYSFFPTQNSLWFVIGCAIFAVVALWQFVERRKADKSQ